MSEIGILATSTNLIRHNCDETKTERIHTLGKISAIMRSICLLPKATTFLEGAVQTPFPRTLLKVIIALQLPDMPGEVFHALLQKGEFSHRLIHFVTILAQQLMATLLTCDIVKAHAYDGPDLP